jgi:hypothetical protein
MGHRRYRIATSIATRSEGARHWAFLRLRGFLLHVPQLFLGVGVLCACVWVCVLNRVHVHNTHTWKCPSNRSSTASLRVKRMFSARCAACCRLPGACATYEDY